MPIHRGSCVWEGKLSDGKGTARIGSEGPEAPVTAGARFAGDAGATPESLLGAAHASCFNMTLSQALTEAGHPPQRLETSAELELQELASGYAITRVRLSTEARVEGISEEQFNELAGEARMGCPVSKALRGVLIDLTASVVS